ncbi:LOW QUALITY PROTEIN: hypothetical protein MC885_001510 [Smutsia gigantea]|nr:LOW QUALITY PROTEIN: hypothetical protein MC885_001510 [Smutsia gigantea]
MSERERAGERQKTRCGPSSARTEISLLPQPAEVVQAEHAGEERCWRHTATSPAVPVYWSRRLRQAPPPRAYGCAAIGPRDRKERRRARGGGWGRPEQEGEWKGAARSGRALGRLGELSGVREHEALRRRRARAAAAAAGATRGLLCFGSPLSLPWRVEEAELVLGALPLPLPTATSPALSRCAVSPTQDCPGPDMARGQQKIQSQQKNAKKQAGQKKKQGHDQKAAAKAALIYTCTVCRTQMPDPKTFKQHFESKHPKTPLPPELADVQA